MYNQIPNWYNGQQIINEYKFIVFGRDNNTPIDCENVKYLNTYGLEDISSTKIREMIKYDYDNVLNYINEYVLKYIKDFNIYK